MLRTVGSLGSADLNQTIPGNLDTCKLNNPTAITVTENKSIVVATLRYSYQDYSWKNAETCLWEMETSTGK